MTGYTVVCRSLSGDELAWSKWSGQIHTAHKPAPVGQKSDKSAPDGSRIRYVETLRTHNFATNAGLRELDGGYIADKFAALRVREPVSRKAFVERRSAPGGSRTHLKMAPADDA
jgi:hypothetical protein